MRKSNQALDLAPGQDSFLDVTCNLVGILIILIMVIGTRTQTAALQADPDAERLDMLPKPDLAAARAAAVAVESDIREIDGKIKRQLVEVAYRRKERDKMLEVLTAVERQLQQQRGTLDGEQQARLTATRELLAAREEWEDLKAGRQALEHAASTPNVIEHLPTPMAKTVFGTELHFRLLQGRLTPIPWDQLVAKLKEEAPGNVAKLKDAAAVTETLGPIGGFWMKYTLRRVQQLASAGGGLAVQQRIELDRFVLVPVQEDLGEPLEQALRAGSEFQETLAHADPDRTTVTVWVYPDSFNQFRTLKAELFRRGFLTAGRPLPEGHPIGGSPDGSRSASQ
ncbi:MAG: hypothetical protein GX575_16565 [Candidatus Anammoximicrobium sp.]|nr:hypothetical protein [Candidatus Anammoximicrobium sp.]